MNNQILNYKNFEKFKIGMIITVESWNNNDNSWKGNEMTVTGLQFPYVKVSGDCFYNKDKVYTLDSRAVNFIELSDEFVNPSPTISIMVYSAECPSPPAFPCSSFCESTRFNNDGQDQVNNDNNSWTKMIKEFFHNVDVNDSSFWQALHQEIIVVCEDDLGLEDLPELSEEDEADMIIDPEKEITVVDNLEELSEEDEADMTIDSETNTLSDEIELISKILLIAENTGVNPAELIHSFIYEYCNSDSLTLYEAADSALYDYTYTS